MQKKGISTLELLIVVAIIVVLSVIILYSFSNFRSTQLLKNESEKIEAIISNTRARTLSAVDSSQYGVHFESGSVTVFKGAVYSQSDPDNEIFGLNEKLEIATTSISGGAVDVVFRRLSGEAIQYGDITIGLIDDPSSSTTITISAVGITE